MCAPVKPDLKELLDNLKTPMSWNRKARLFLRNNLVKIQKRQTCCGNAGEPGC